MSEKEAQVMTWLGIWMQNRKFRLAQVIVFCISWSTTSLFAHPAHETNSEMIWNAESRSLEVAVRLRSVDLEATLAPKGTTRVDLESTKSVDGMIVKYLESHFVVTAPDGSETPLEFAGKETSARDVWLYFEFPLGAAEPTGYRVANRLLFGVLDHQTNRLEFRSASLRYTLVFTEEHPEHEIHATQVSIKSDWKPPESLDSLPSVDVLPDLFTMANHRRVTTIEQWNQRRSELEQIIQYYEYGSMPPRPDTVAATHLTRQKDDHGFQERMTLVIGSVEQLKLRISIHLPASSGRHPVIVKEVHQIGDLPCIPMFVDKGYAFVQYQREDLDADQGDVIGPAQAAYPDADWATLAVWAWGAMRVVDYLETRDDIDLARIAVTGHSRGGKSALLAGALDERFALVAPNGSGCGGAGCFRDSHSKNETLGKITDPMRFGYWFHLRLRWFDGQEDRLPLDQHFVKALVAPRALLCTEARGDLWANPEGTRRTSVAARDVYSFLSVQDKIGLCYRDGEHGQTLDDWQRLLDFAQWHFFGEDPPDRKRFWQTP